MAQKELSIIIIDYNSSRYLIDCLLSIVKNTTDVDYEIIVVDNASTENHLRKYEMIDKRIKTFRSDKNLGFGGGNNFGAKEALGEYLLLLNPDTIIFDNSTKTIFDFIRAHSEIGALTCLMGPTKNTLQKNFFGKFQSLASVTIRRYNYPRWQKASLVSNSDSRIHSEARRDEDSRKRMGRPRALSERDEPSKSSTFFYTDIITGAALMIKKSIYEDLKGFDEQFFMYLEDDDLCKRLVNAGYKNAVLNTARIIHLEGKTSNFKQKKKYYYKSQDRYWQKHNGTIPTMLMKIIRWPYKTIVSLC